MRIFAQENTDHSKGFEGSGGVFDALAPLLFGTSEDGHTESLAVLQDHIDENWLLASSKQSVEAPKIAKMPTSQDGAALEKVIHEPAREWVDAHSRKAADMAFTVGDRGNGTGEQETALAQDKAANLSPNKNADEAPLQDQSAADRTMDRTLETRSESVVQLVPFRPSEAPCPQRTW